MADTTTPVQTTATNQDDVPCCPQLPPDTACDVLDYHYRLMHFTNVQARDQNIEVPVEVKIHVRFERCPGPMTLGDLAYSTTLFPGEKVRLFTTDRRSRFTFDSSSNISYRNEQTSSEHFFMSSVNDFMSDVSSRDDGHNSSNVKGSSQGHGGASGAIETIFAGPSVNTNSSYNASSASDFLRETAAHAVASTHRSEMGSKISNSVSIGEVQTRTHAQGESEDQFESSSREFSNSNQCHAVTYYFYSVNKSQTIKFSLESIDRRVIDPIDNTKMTNNAFLSTGAIATIPNGVLATDKQRLDVESIGRQSVVAQQTSPSPFSPAGQTAFTNPTLSSTRLQSVLMTAPYPQAVREQALLQVDQELVNAGLLTAAGGTVSKQIQEEVSFERHFSLPTAGFIVKGCLDDCNVCEPTLLQSIQLDLARKQLENDLLKKQIDLLEKSQQYRCCPDSNDGEP